MGKKGLLVLGILVFLIFPCKIGSGNGIEKFVLSRDGKAQAVIQIPGDAPPIVRFAAGELKNYLNKITGAKFEVKGPDAANKDGMSRIILGNCAESQKAGLDVNTLSPDGFYIKCSGKVMFLCGRDDPKAHAGHVFQIHDIAPFQHGTLLAVYYLLENYCGVRWLFPGEIGEYVPKKDSLSIPVLSLKEEPVMKMRTNYATAWSDLRELYGANYWREYNLFLVRQGRSGWKISTSHYFSYDYTVSRWLKSHPEYFALNVTGKRDNKAVPGQGWGMCFSNPDLAHEVALDAIAYFKGEPASARNLPEQQFQHFGFNRESLAINPADVDVGYCRCSECQKYRDADGKFSELAWLYYTRVAEEVARECPGKIISTWSYGDYQNVPKTLKKVPENVRVYLVTNGAFGWHFKRSRLHQIKRMQDWYKFSGNKLSLWVNMCLRATRPSILGGVPSPVAKPMALWMKEIAPYVDGVYMHNFGSPYMFEAMNTYLYYHLAWNPERDSEKILADYYAAAYGPAANIIRKMEEEFERIWFDRVFTTRTRMGTAMMGDTATLPTLAEVWEDIYTDERLTEFKKKMANAVKVAKGTEFEQRVGVFEKYYFGAVLSQKQKHMELLNLADDIRLRAARASNPIIADGNISESDWSKSEKGNMAVIEEGVKPNVETEVRVLYDDENLYISWKCYEPEMGRLRLIATKHDEDIIWKDDEVEVFIDPAGQRRDYYQIMANTAGVVTDIRYMGGQYDKGWESGAKVGVVKKDDYWSLEMVIPYAAMGVKPPKEGDSWVANFCRGRALLDAKPGESQFLSWSKLLKGAFNKPGEFGRIDFSESEQDKDNILKNGSFENGTAGWGGLGYSIDTEERWSGEKSIKLVKTDPDANSSILQRFPGKIKPNTEYAFTYYIKVKDVKPVPGATAKVLPGIGAQVHIPEGWFPCPAPRSLMGTQDWRKYGVRFKTGEKFNPNATICFDMRYATGTAWIDDVRLYEIKK